MAALRADPIGAAAAPRTDTVQQLAGLGGRLDDTALALLADALDNATDVIIRYRDRNGTVTYRVIQPREIHGRWIDSWCHLRDAQRDFAVDRIESVAPLR